MKKKKSLTKGKPEKLHWEIAEIVMKPCPFCGEIPNVFQIPDDTFVEGELNWVVECKSMGCVFKRSSPNRSLKNLVCDWNKRRGAE